MAERVAIVSDVIEPFVPLFEERAEVLRQGLPHPHIMFSESDLPWADFQAALVNPDPSEIVYASVRVHDGSLNIDLGVVKPDSRRHLDSAWRHDAEDIFNAAPEGLNSAEEPMVSVLSSLLHQEPMGAEPQHEIVRLRSDGLKLLTHAS